MNRSAIITVVVAAVVVLGGGALLLSRHYSSNTNSTSSSTMNMTTKSSTSNSKPTATNSVTIQNFAFSPSSITVKKGTTVTWTNQDSATHTVTSTSGPKSFASGDLPNGKTFSVTFDTTGTYQYKCSIHPSMTGTVTVTE